MFWISEISIRCLELVGSWLSTCCTRASSSIRSIREESAICNTWSGHAALCIHMEVDVLFEHFIPNLYQSLTNKKEETEAEGGRGEAIGDPIF